MWVGVCCERKRGGEGEREGVSIRGGKSVFVCGCGCGCVCVCVCVCV